MRVAQKLLERIPHLAWLMTNRGEIITVNHQWWEYVGRRSADDDRPWLFAEILHPAQRATWAQAWAQASSSQTATKLKIQLQGDGGNWEWFELELDPDACAVAPPERLRHRVASGSEQGLLPRQPRPYRQGDESGQIVWVCIAVRCGIATTWQQAVDGGSSVDRGDDRTVPQNGQMPWSEPIDRLSPDTESQTASMSGSVADVTNRDRTEIDLKTSEELFRHTFEQTPLGLAHVGMDGSLLRVNRKFCEIVGYSSAELLATTFQAITEPNDLDGDLALLAQLLTGEIDEYTLEKRYIHKQGHHVWVNLTVAVMRATTKDRPGYLLGAIKDITDRKQLEILSYTQSADLQRLNNSLMLAQQQLQERNLELDRFVSIAAHDLKAPLRAIANLATWIEADLQAQIPGDRPQLQLLRQRVNRMDALIDGLLRYSRAGSQQLATETVDVAAVLAETIDSLSPPGSFQIEIATPMPILDTKRLLLTQVFANLIGNAIKHHDRVDGRVEITAEDLGDRFKFSIADDGPGIPPGESQERIFEIFQTLKPATNSTENTGIGLALVKKIVAGEGGELWLDRAYAPGSRFWFTWLKPAVNTVGNLRATT